MARRSSLRASDAEREEIAERLRHATAEGRLLAEELEERLGSALTARTHGELDALVTDLPRPRPGRRRGQLPVPRSIPEFALAVVLVMAAVIVMIGLALLVAGFFVLWGFWILLGWWLFGHRRWARPSRRYMYGPRYPYGRRSVSGPPRL